MDAKFRRRLTILRDALLKFPSEELKLQMSIWFRKSECGTVCCALGLASTIPELREQGLTRIPSNNSSITGEFIIVYAGCTGYDAAEHFFDLSLYNTRSIFAPETYGYSDITPLEVAGRISEILNRELVEA